MAVRKHVSRFGESLRLFEGEISGKKLYRSKTHLDFSSGFLVLCLCVRFCASLLSKTTSVMDSLRESFKSQYAAKGRNPEKEVQGQLPILLDEEGKRAHNHQETLVKMDNVERSSESKLNDNLWRESSCEFWKNGEKDARNAVPRAVPEFDFQAPPRDDPPTKLLGQFLHKQKDCGEVSLDMDLDMDEFRAGRNLRAIKESPKEIYKDPLVSLNGPSAYSNEVNTCNSGSSNRYESSGEVLKCSSNLSFHRKSSLFRTKTKSRLMDPPAQRCEDRKSNKMRSAQMKSSVFSRGLVEDEADPFWYEDLPVEYKRANLGAMALLQWVSLLIIVAALVCSVSIRFLVRQTVWGVHLWKWEVSVLVLICGRLVSGWVISLVVFFIEQSFLLRKRVLYFVYGLRKAVQNCLWLGLVLITWQLMFDKKVEKETNGKVLLHVTKTLVCLLMGTIIWLAKTLLVKVLASSFHVNTYFDRIQDDLFNQYVIETLTGLPLIEIRNIREEEENVMAEVQKLQNAGAKVPADLRAAALPVMSGRVIGSGALPRSTVIGKSVQFSGGDTKKQDEGITIDQLHKLNQHNISAWNMKRLMNMVRHGVLSTLDDHLTGMDQEDESAVQIRSECEAKIAAKKIFNIVAKPGSKYIYLVDLMRFMREDEALKTMSLFEGANDAKRINKSALKNWVVEAFRERRSLSLTLNDTKTAVNKLHQMVNIIVGVIIVIIWLLILGIATTHFLVFISSQLLLVVFIFGNTCKMIFEDIIFLFVMHPFDVGDRCEVEGVQMVVEEMNILSTVFLRYDNMKIAYPNSVLATMPISNFYRSPDMGDSIDFCIHVATPVEKVAIMKERIKEFIENKKEHWYPSPTVMLRDVEDMNKLEISVWLQHRMNFQNMGERWNRRELVVQEMIKVLRELDVEYRMLPVDVNLRNMPPLSSSRLPSTWAT